MQLKATQQFEASVQAFDAKGNPAALEDPKWAVSPPELGVFVADPTDGAKGTFLAGATGSGQLGFLADGIVGEGVSVIAAQLEITVIAGDAVSVTINAGAVTDQPAGGAKAAGASAQHAAGSPAKFRRQ